MEHPPYAQYSFNRIESAARHYQAYGADLDIMDFPAGKFQYCKRVCVFGKSFVCSSASVTGWGYELNTEIDGFLFTFPHTGSMSWKTRGGTFKANAGALAVVDQREVLISTYTPGIRSTSIYIENTEIVKHLTLLLGFQPKSRTYFHRSTIESWEIRFITTIANTILDYAEHSQVPFKGVLDSLKETMIGFLVNNISNTHKDSLIDVGNVPVPTPYAIKSAVEFMTFNTDPELTVGDVATFTGISVRSLQVGFKRYKGMSPLQFLRKERLMRARTLLLQPGSACSPQRAALQVGFLNYHVFCKYYIQLFGEHPKATHIATNR
ncbi:helix-turn-helix domain-containing protein [Pseudomonas syringae pv. tagetis]|uniref:Helix-turn-helix domain-containing protein n=2 Tax=Pseudomonas TaxID=286 RepID=A0A0Q0EIQ4_9PSED|nr:helix-turn-helix domain-containing protein [Pseudomonas syringae group genomosp. 7]KPY86251.1 putative regulatory protein [Pseudomonas syringae pv. tagetis]RMW08511.1 hypothetical protein ALO98_200143 [Pseudomonas syringae pv. tagetis]RMW14442.1 putative regulatory protein [Pseudomonas syringae pv. tagetis]UNB69346.1 helix-turn-helix domain-containing protein [Pseudomonas syringae pv. tagetis]